MSSATGTKRFGSALDEVSKDGQFKRVRYCNSIPCACRAPALIPSSRRLPPYTVTLFLGVTPFLNQNPTDITST